MRSIAESGVGSAAVSFFCSLVTTGVAKSKAKTLSPVVSSRDCRAGSH